MEIKHPFSFWLQLSSFAFFLAGNFSDLLIVRTFLSLAYVCTLLNGMLGAPMWPLLFYPDHIQLDAIIWSLINLYVHLSTVFRLFYDERNIILTDHEQALWRLFYRTGGLSKLMFQRTIAQHCTVIQFQSHETIPTNEWFYIILQGTVKITVVDENGTLVSSRKAQSGQMFDFRALGLLHDISSVAKHRLSSVVAITNVTAFRFQSSAMTTIASHPATRLIWKELLMENLLRIVQRYFEHRSKSKSIRTNIDSGHFINPMFAPLLSSEEPHPLRAGSSNALYHPLEHLWACMEWSFTPPWPFQGPLEGLRHASLPAPMTQGADHVLPPRSVLEANETSSLLSEYSSSSLRSHGGSVASSSSSLVRGYASYQQISSLMAQEEDDDYVDYKDEFDEQVVAGMSYSFSR
jgi:CRP-like cAMP-binding protein